MIRVHDSCESADFRNIDSTCLLPEVLQKLMTTDSSLLVSNVQTKYYLAQLERFYFPVTVNDTEYENSYVCSPYTGIVSYPIDELQKIGSLFQRTGIRMLASMLSPVLKASKINRVLCVNNSMLSTNLYPNWNGEQLAELTLALSTDFPHHAIMFRSLNFATNPELCNTFKHSNYQFVPSRLLYVVDPSDASVPAKQNNKIDFRWLCKTVYSLVRHSEFSDRDDERIKMLYDQLYLGKYSECNPKFTVAFIRLMRKSNQMQFLGLRDQTGQLVGVIATLELNNQFTTPIVGYDLEIPQSKGLYRLLTSLVIRKSLSEGKLFNMSSGVGRFKKHRGATPHLEYSAIYTSHLPKRQRMAWRTIGWLMQNVAAPIVQKNEL